MKHDTITEQEIIFLHLKSNLKPFPSFVEALQRFNIFPSEYHALTLSSMSIRILHHHLKA